MAWQMTPRNWGGGPEFDMQLAEEIERRIVGFEQQREEARGDPELARRLIDHAQQWGEHARPGVLEGMARAGLEADDDVSAAIAEEAGSQQLLEGKPDIGERVNGRDLRGSLTDAAKTFVRGGFTMLEAPFREVGSAVTAAGATFLDDEQDLSDWLDNYVDHGGSRMRKAVQEWREQGVDWRGLPILGDTVANALPEGDQGIRWSGEEDFLGEGWLPSQESGISQQVEEEKHRLSDDGEFLTPGRLIPHGLNKAAGRTIIEPDSTAYHAVSGLADFAANIALDPATYVTGGYAKIAQASKQFGTHVDNLGPVARRMANSSLIPTPRADLIGENVDEFLARPEGAAVVDAIRDVTSPNLIRRGFNGKVDNDIAVNLARADSDDAVREVLGGTLGARAGMMQKPRARQFTGRREGPLSNAVGSLAGERGLPTFDRVRNKTWQTSKLPGVRRNLQGVRLFHWAPQRMLDKNDPRHAAQMLDDHLRNAKVSDEKATELIDEFMGNSVRRESGLPDFEAMSSSIHKINQSVEEELFDRLASRRFIESREARRARKSARKNQLDELDEDALSGDEIAEMVDPAERAALTETRRRARDLAHVSSEAMEEYSRAARQYLHDEMGKPIIPPGGKRKMVVNGEEFDMNGGLAYMLAHARDDLSVLPDHREIRRVASQFGPLLDTPFFGTMTRSGVDFLHYKVMSKVWKPATLLRPAYMMRVVPEEQARIAAEGDASLWNHPIRYLSYVLGQRGKGGLVDDDLRNAPQHSAALNPTYSYDYQGAPIQHSQLSGDWVMRAARGKDGTPLEGTVEDWAGYLGKFAVDPVARPMAGMDINDAKQAFWSGDLSRKRRELIDKMGMTALRNKGDADEWVDGLFHSMQVATGGDPSRGIPGNSELLSGIAQGKITDVPVSLEGTNNIFTDPVFFRDPQVTSRLGDHADSSMPNFLPRARRSAFERQEERGLLDKATGTGFALLVSWPSDKLSRSPHFKQRYWDRVDQLLPSMTRKAQRQTIQRAKKANLERSKIKAMERKAARQNDAKLDDVNFIDDTAKAQALDDTKELLYDVTRRSQFGEALRVAAPFAEAWKEIMATWFKLSRDNPAIIRRGQQAIDGARRSDPAKMIEGGDPSEGGFFYQEDGQEMFAYPGGKQLARVIGLNRATEGEADVELTGRASGLNLVGNSVLPGLGPAVTIPASMIIPEDAKTGALQELIFPFGEPEADSPGAAIDDMAPPWLQRAITAWRSNPQKDRIFGNTVIDTMRALKATGNYSHPETGAMTQEQMNRLEADGQKYAKRLYWFRALAQTTMPTGPQPEFTVETPEEEMTFQALMEEYRGELSENPREAFNNFTERFGVDLALSTQAKTKEIRPRAVTEKGLEWERRNADLFDSFPNVAGFFTPEDPEGEFDYNAYLRQLETGDRADLKPDQVLQLQNHQLGRLSIENAERKLGEMADTSEGRAFLSRLRSQLRERYPGYLSQAGIPSGVSLDRQLAEFRKAANDERLRGHPISAATREWMRVRDTAESFARTLPGNIKSFESAQAARPIRDWMRAEARRIIEQYPQWAPVYDRVFSREMTSDDFDQEPEEFDLTKEPDWSLGEEG